MKQLRLSLILLLSSFSLALGQSKTLKPENYLTDEVKLFADSLAQKINEQLAAFEQDKGHQIFIYIGDTLMGKDLDEFGPQLAEQWGVGKKESDNGVLLTIFIKDRKVRIDVGYGLEASLTDLEANRIISEEIGPAFRRGAYFTGVQNAIQAIQQEISRAITAPAPAQSLTSGQETQKKKSKYYYEVPFTLLMTNTLLMSFWGYLAGLLLLWSMLGKRLDVKRKKNVSLFTSDEKRKRFWWLLYILYLASLLINIFWFIPRWLYFTYFLLFPFLFVWGLVALVLASIVWAYLKHSEIHLPFIRVNVGFQLFSLLTPFLFFYVYLYSPFFILWISGFALVLFNYFCFYNKKGRGSSRAYTYSSKPYSYKSYSSSSYSSSSSSYSSSSSSSSSYSGGSSFSGGGGGSFGGGGASGSW